MTPAIVTQGLTKRFGAVTALSALDLEVAPGEVMGFLGPNGAGKTTTIRLLVDLLRPTAGSVHVLGRDPRQEAVAVRRRIGYLPAELAVDPRLTAGQLLDWFAHLRGGVERRRRDDLVERLGLDESRPLGVLSTGNRKKAGIVQAFMHRPELVILDEPTSGLDPLVQRAFATLVRDAAADGAAVFLSSHVLAEVEDAADRVAIVRAGRLVALDTVAALTQRAVRHVLLRFAEPVPAGAFAGLDGVREVFIDGAVVDATVTGSPDALIKAAAGYRLVDLSPRETDLEEAFLAYYRDVA